MNTRSSIKDRLYTKKRSQRRIFTITVVLSVVAILTFIYTIVISWDSQAKFYAKWIQCGHQPLEGVHAFKSVSYYEKTSAVNLFRDTRTDYFCTPKQAELKGYSSDSGQYNFPHLSQEERDGL